MNSILVVATLPFDTILPPSALKPLNVPATTSANAATTKIQNSQQKSKNNFLPILPIYASITYPIVRPLFLTEAYIAEKSWTAPKNNPPIRIHNKTGTQPNTAAWIGPLIGPAPAIEANWWPNTIAVSAGS